MPFSAGEWGVTVTSDAVIAIADLQGAFMFTASCYFLGLAVFLFAAIVCFTTGKRAGKYIEVDLDSLHAASVCLSTGRRAGAENRSTETEMYREMTWDEKIKFSDIRTIWARWYERCRKKAIQKQKVLYSWARTMVLSAALCLIGVILEVEFGQPVTLKTIMAGFHQGHVTTPTNSTPTDLPVSDAPPRDDSSSDKAAL
jgi:hypothetical protein